MLAAMAFFVAAAPAAAADRNYTVTSFEELRVDGAIDVVLVTGVAPYARAIGASGATQGVRLDTTGYLLTVSIDRTRFSGFVGENPGPLTVEIGTPSLKRVWVNGAGSLTIDRIRALEFGASVQGTGALLIDEVDVDQFRVSVGGAANVRVSGEAKEARFIVRGMSGLDASQLEVNDLRLGIGGPSFARVDALSSATIQAVGSSDVRVTGRPACTLDVSGAARVTGCRQ